MRLLVLGEEEAVLGFSLAGIKGKVARFKEEVQRGLEEALQDPELGIVLITNDAANLIREEVDRLRLSTALPLILEIPGSKGPITKPTVRELVAQAVGVSL
jgi:V/A-type H+-transporting ATPase subunit F